MLPGLPHESDHGGTHLMLADGTTELRLAQPSRALIVDDDPGVRKALQLVLKNEGFAADEAGCVAEARERLVSEQYELVLLDLNMPGEHGLVLLQEYGDRIPETVFVVVTANADAPNAVAALKQGAYDYVCKPFDTDDLLHVIDGALERRERELQERRRQEDLEGLVAERTEHLYSALGRLQGAEAAIKRVACSLAEIRDAETGAHLKRMAVYARELAQALPEPFKARHGIDGAFVELLFEAAPLHDIGKIGVPDRILLKPGPLDAIEERLMRQHCRVGERILVQAAASYPGAEELPLLLMGREICAHHHEHFDGTGYPDGWAGDQIPAAARIIAVADVYDALATPRPYRPVGYDRATVSRMIREQRGRAFDPEILDAFDCVEAEMARIATAVQDGVPGATDGVPARLPRHRWARPDADLAHLAGRPAAN